MFSNPEGRYILKGGSGLLARIPGARSTRDLDFAARPRVSAEDALREMEDVTALDLGDFCRFVLTRHEEAMDENGYSRLLKLRFATYVGEQEKDPHSHRSLARLHADASARADEVAQPYRAGRLALAVRAECGKREMDVPKEFKAPEEWCARFRAFATRNHVPTSFRDFDAASELALGGRAWPESWRGALTPWERPDARGRMHGRRFDWASSPGASGCARALAHQSKDKLWVIWPA